MAVQMGQGDIILGTLEVSFGIATAMLFTLFTMSSSDATARVLIAVGCTAGLVPLLMRWSLKFWASGTLDKPPELVVCIWALVCYIVGGVMIIIEIVNHDANQDYYSIAICSIIVGIVTIIDLIVSMKN